MRAIVTERDSARAVRGKTLLLWRCARVERQRDDDNIAMMPRTRGAL